MKLYVARHGQTAWNAEMRICGRTDLELTEEGKKQAVVLAEQVAGKGIARILVSPLRRAQQTAGFIAEKLNLPWRPSRGSSSSATESTKGRM